MTGLLIPDDWGEAQDGFCDLTFTVPNSNLWRSTVRGQILNLAYAEHWDEDTAAEGGGSGSYDGQVAAGADDAYEADNNTGFDASNTLCRADSNPVAGSRRNAGFRFTGPTSPGAAQITAAHITIQCTSTAHDDPNVNLHGELIADALDFVANPDVTSRTRTNNFTQWTAQGIGTGPVNSPDISPVIQEIIGQPGWLEGNAIVILVDGRDDATFDLWMRSFEGNPGQAAKLHLEWTAGGGTSAEQAAAIGMDIFDSYAVVCP